jgi:ribosomal protein L3 glutamine methyltransferase
VNISPARSAPGRGDDPVTELSTIRDFLRLAVSRFSTAGIVCGHGTTDLYDEAVWLLLGTLGLPLERLEPFLDARLTGTEKQALLAVIDRRAQQRVPAAYLLHEAWLGDYRFYVDERVIVPRSYLAEFLADGLQPWIADAQALDSALDMCTGSGCLAILLAQAFPNASVDAVDLSPDALAVAERNRSDYRLEARIRLLHSDLYAELGGCRYDLILSNPPYVTDEAMACLPTEYRHEPRLALAGGQCGMDVVSRLIEGAAEHLRPGGVLAVEVGHNRAMVEHAHPELDFTWLTAADGSDAVFVLERSQLP